VLVDCQPDTLNIDPERIEEKITPKTKAIIPVHMGGHACDMDRILEIARKHDLKVIEDAAHALPARYQGKMIGTVGDITCFSFYVTKTITTGEGGMATTDNPEWADRMRMMSLHGISKDAWKRYTSEGSWYYEVVSPGYKYNLTDIAAALGIEQLKKCDRFHEARARIARCYDDAFQDIPEIKTPACRSAVLHAWHLYIIQIDSDRLSIDRNQFVEMLKQRGIGTSVHFIPLHMHPFYRDFLRHLPLEFPKALGTFRRIISLPVYPGMSDGDIQKVTDAVRQIIQKYRKT
jgi:perosamine synthetase